MTTHPFDTAVDLQPEGDNAWFGHTSPAYGNMVGPFGGITAAQALSAVLQHPQLLGEPVSLTVNFAGALADGPFTVTARPARTNRSTQHWVLEIVQDGEVMLTGTAFTALRRQVWSADEHTMPPAPPPAQVSRAEGPAKVEWVNRYEMRFIEGGYPAAWDGTDHQISRTRIWMRDSPPRPLDFASLTALADMFFPRIWRRRATLVPIGTVSMTVYYHADSALLKATGDGYLQGQTHAQAFRNGYYDQTAQLWSEKGELLATTHQIVYYKE
jgi:acyl-CoA thioesterase